MEGQKKIRRLITCIVVTFIFSVNLYAVPSIYKSRTDTTRVSCLLNSDTLNKCRLRYAIISESALYATSIIGLNQLWYKDYPRSNFHFFNDNAEWGLMDKAGHGFTSYQLGQLGYNVLKWSGVDETKSTIYGGGLGTMFLTSVEILDGFSSAWGFSTGDFIANTSGSLLFIGQQAIWTEQRISLKYSFRQSKYSELRPDQLGENFLQNLIKDYNGQTYWISCNIASFIKKENKFPKWLGFAVGYGVDGLTGARNNRIIDQYISRDRQFYISLDVDLLKIPTKNPLLKTIFKSFGFLKFPAPTLEFKNMNTVKLHGLYF